MVRNLVRLLTVLVAFTLFAGMSFAQGGSDAGTKQGTDTTKSSSKKGTKTPKSKQVDINSATKEQLTAVSGIDDATADKIIAGRPYKTKKDLVTTNILTQDQYDKVKDQLVAHGGKGTKKGSDAMKKDDSMKKK